VNPPCFNKHFRNREGWRLMDEWLRALTARAA
jgi:hypothetical protein